LSRNYSIHEKTLRKNNQEKELYVCLEDKGENCDSEERSNNGTDLESRTVALLGTIVPGQATIASCAEGSIWAGSAHGWASSATLVV
jgi:hypothetical protein